MAKERAARRAERERMAVQRAGERAVVRAQEARRQARLARVRRLLPSPRRRPDGVLVRRRRDRNRVLVGVAVAVQVMGWFLARSVTVSVALLLFTAFAAPVTIRLLFDRRS